MVNLERHQSENQGGICRVLIFKTCDLPNLSITQINEDTFEFVEDLVYMSEITPDSGQYQEPDIYNEHGTSFSANITFTVAKDRIAQRQLVRSLFNRQLSAFVKNNNGTWKYFQNLSLRSNLTSARQKTSLNNYSYSLFGTSMVRSFFADRQIKAIMLTTNWNEGIDGPFSANFTASQTGKWIFPSGLIVTGNSVNATGTGLNGTGQEVKFTIDDFGSITAANLNSTKLAGVIDFSLVQFNGNLIASFNPDFTNFILSDFDNVITSIEMQNSGLFGVIDLSSAKITLNLRLASNSGITQVIHSTLITQNNTISNLYDLSSCGNLQSIDFNSFEFNISTQVISFRSCNLSVSEIDALLIDIDNVAALSNAIIQFDGLNASPTGGVANPNVVSLVGKGYTVNIN